MPAFLATVAAKIAALSAGAKATLAAVVATSAIGGVALAQVPSDPTPRSSDDVTTTSVADTDTSIPDASTPDTAPSSDAATEEQVEASDEEIETSAEGTNTLDGAPPVVLAAIAEHCGDTTDVEWSWESSTDSDGTTEEDIEVECIDAAGCDIEVEVSSDEAGDEREIENSCVGTNTLDGAPPAVLAAIAEHCGDTTDVEWSWESSTDSDGTTEEDIEVECIDAAGCDIEVEVSSDDDVDDDLEIEISCNDDADDDDEDEDDADDDDEDEDDADDDSDEDEVEDEDESDDD